MFSSKSTVESVKTGATERQREVGKEGSTNSCILISPPVFPLTARFSVFIISGTALGRTSLSVGEVDNYPFNQLFTMNILSAIFLMLGTPLVMAATKMNQRTPIHKEFILEGRYTQSQPTKNFNQNVSKVELCLCSDLMDKMGVCESRKGGEISRDRDGMSTV